MADIDMLLAALAHQTRRSALRLLQHNDELCLCEFMARLGVGQSTMSRHMATLKEAGLVNDRRDAQWVRYRLHPCLDEAARQIVLTVLGADARDEAERIAHHEGRSAA